MSDDRVSQGGVADTAYLARMPGYRKSATAEDVVWNGRRYRREPAHPERSRRVYFMATTAPRTYLHRDVWEATNGRPVPAGHHVHHKDGNALNNDPGNLAAVLEAEHLSHHGTHHEVRTFRCGRCGVDFESPRPWARWCSSACKEAQRRADGVAYVRPRTPFSESRPCEECGELYGARKPWQRFCTPACKQRFARRQ